MFREDSGSAWFSSPQRSLRSSPKGATSSGKDSGFALSPKRFLATPSTSACSSSEEEEWRNKDPFKLAQTLDNNCLDAISVADSLEKGLSREIVTEFTVPVRPSAKLRRHHVLKSEDALEYRLLSDGYDFILYACVRTELRRIDIFGYDPQQSAERLFDPTRPAFTMSYNAAGTEWRLVQERCEHCRFAPSHLSCDCHGKQQIACVRHFSKKLGDGLSNCMEVRIPGLLEDGSPMVWCPRLGVPDLASPKASMGSEIAEAQRLVSKLPEWNEEVRCLVLDFEGRTVTAAPSNFQLALPEDLGCVVCQYGQIGRNTFSLDFKQPLSVVQAFAMSLSAMFLK